MRISKLFRLSVRRGLEKKLLPAISALGAGNKAERRAARGSIEPAAKTLVGSPLPLIGTPQKPLGFRGWLVGTLGSRNLVSRVLKISPTNVGFPLQSSATVPGMGVPSAKVTWGTV